VSNWKRGDLVELAGLLAVVVGVEGDPEVPEEHVALWFGEPRAQRSGGPSGLRPELWTVPADLCVRAADPVYGH